MRLLIVEDEAALREQIHQRLSSEGFVVDLAEDGDTGLHLATDYPVDLAIVDLGLPGRSGLELIRELRGKGSRLPVLILTARDGWQDRVIGLESGADDYLTKPFHFEELLARVNALLRRSAGWAHPELPFGPYRLHTANKQLSFDGEDIPLTAYEYRLLEYLAFRPGQVVSKQDLTEHLYPDEADRDSNVIEVFIRRLRQKLDPDSTLQPIVTHRGLGYSLRQADHDEGS
ncbi:two-component system response regulator PhoP [Natronocella acetinitrilica]|uniref:Two-component system response regulator PhoP n=1 Tax=Natronocella acetinitrilica TaxID=414046 RepID=A0AAE3KF77_9GAMM|nr:response regulator transcription factor [Natronocella acetinitrilica]MCP1673792.1 two-component system response regulator PhoP [Natronocella acetinitrilica]